MSSPTYVDLLADVSRWAQNSDDEFTSSIPRFVMMAENLLAREAKVLGYERYVNSTMITGVPVYAKPDRWRRTISVAIGTGTSNVYEKFLYQRDKTFIGTFWPNDNLTDEPTYWCDLGFNNIKIASTPEEDYPYQWGYYERPEPLSDTVSQNWNTEYIYDVLLGTTLLQAMPFLKNWDLVQQWRQVYSEYVQASSVEEFRRTLDRPSGQEAKGGP